MALAKLRPVDKPPCLPLRPAERAEVIAADVLVDRAAGEVERARLAVTGAEAGLAAHRESAADRLLEALEAGTEVVDPAGAAHLQVLEQARQRLATAEQAHALARVRHARVLAAARHEFTSEVRPLLMQAIEHTAELLAPAIAANARVLELAAHAEDAATTLGHAYEMKLPIPSTGHLEELMAARRRMFAGQRQPPANLVPLRLTARHGCLMPGDVASLPPDEARLLILGIYAEAIDPADAKRLGCENPMRFSEPTRLRLLKDLQVDVGTFQMAGSTHTFDPVTASRLVNLSMAEPAK